MTVSFRYGYGLLESMVKERFSGMRAADLPHRPRRAEAAHARLWLESVSVPVVALEDEDDV